MQKAQKGIRFMMLIAGCGAAIAQGPPVITGPNGAASVAFWYLGGVTPNCCGSLINKYWTVWDVNLATNSPNPTPVIQWFTDSPAKIQITPQGTTGARLTALGHSAPGANFDIRIWVTVDGVSSAQFPVFINTPWTHIQTAPAAFSTCAGLFGPGNAGWVGRVTNSVQDLTGATITPIDARETFENDVRIYPGENWPAPTETAWTSAIWQANSFFDTYAMCWTGDPAQIIPNTIPWNPNGFSIISSDTQKYWMGSFFRFQGKCTERKAVAWYADHISHSNLLTPITNDSGNGPCAQGQFAN